MSDLIKIVFGGVFSSGVLVFVLTRFLDWLKVRKQTKEAELKRPTILEQSVCWMMQEQLREIMLQSITDDVVSVKKKSYVNRGYDLYHELGGDGEMTELYEAFQELDVDYLKEF